MDLTKEQINKLKFFQKNEITEYRIYKRLARRVRADNAEVLSEIADEELKHYNFGKEYSGEEIKPNPWRGFIPGSDPIHPRGRIDCERGR